MSSGRLLEPGGNVRSRWMAIRVETHDRTRGMWGLVHFQGPPLRRVLLYPAAVGMPVYRVSVYRVSGRIGQHTFQSRRSCSSQTVYRTFCRRSQTTQRRHNLLPTPMTPSAPAQPSTDAHRPLSFGKNRGIFGETAHADNADLHGLDAGTTGESRQSAKSDGPREPSSCLCVNHPRARPTSMRRSSCATVLVRNRPHTDSWSCIRFHRALFSVRDRPHTRRSPLTCIRHQSQIERRDEHADSYDAPRHAHHLDHVKIHDETRSPRAAMPGHAVSWRIRASRL